MNPHNQDPAPLPAPQPGGGATESNVSVEKPATESAEPNANGLGSRSGASPDASLPPIALPVRAEAVVQRITDYLTSGGLFNPEMANHDAVRDLLINARAALNSPRSETEGREEVKALAGLAKTLGCPIAFMSEVIGRVVALKTEITQLRVALSKSGPEAEYAGPRCRCKEPIISGGRCNRCHLLAALAHEQEAGE